MSVIVPTFNCAEFVGAAIMSVLSQNYAPIEIIVVDDGSTDDTAQIAAGFGPPVRVLRQANRGPAAARNLGVKDSHGELLAFLDGDDVWLPGKLEAQVRYLVAHGEAPIVYGDVLYWEPDESGIYPASDSFGECVPTEEFDPELSGWIYHELLLDSAICIITALIRRHVYETLGGLDESLRVGEDYDFWIRAARRFPVTKLRMNTALYRKHRQSTTHQAYPESPGLAVVLRAIERYGITGPDGRRPEARSLKLHLARLCFEHGYTHYHTGNPCIATRSFLKSLQFQKSRLRALPLAALAGARCLVRKAMAWDST